MKPQFDPQETETRLKEGALSWLAERDPQRWITASGKVCITRLARDAGVNRTYVYKVLDGTHLPGLKFQRRLRALAMSTGVSRLHAERALFEDVAVSDEAQAA